MSIVKMLKYLRCKILIKLNRSNIHMSKNSSFGRGTVLFAPNSINIGDNVYIGKYCSLETDIEIGNYVLIGNNVGIIGKYDHDYTQIGTPIKDAQWIGDKKYDFLGKDKKVVIEDDVWIGYGAIILSGVTVKKGSIVAAGSVVTNDTEEYTIVAGNPARVIKNRFGEEELLKHKQIIKEKYNVGYK